MHKGENVFIIAADTLVYIVGKIIGKPRDEAQATQILSALSASRHEVYTGFTLCDGKRVYTSHERTDVYFKRLSAEEISRYVATGEPMDKAGAYGVQGIGKLFVERVEGDFFGAMGLPICRVAMEARRIFGITL